MDFDAAKDYYALLKVDRTATQEQVKKAYLTLAKKYHPDTKRALHDDDVEEVFTEMYQQVNEAYHVLGDPVLRRAYDAARGHGAPGASDARDPGPRGDPPPAGPRGSAHRAPPPPAGDAPVNEVDLPNVIRSDRGLLFVRRRARDPYIGEDGATYAVTREGTIRALEHGFVRSMDRYVVVGSAGEVAAAWLSRQVMRVLWGLARVLSATLLHYALFVSMLAVHRNPLRRLRQERSSIGPLLYVPVVVVSAAVVLGHLLVLLRAGDPVLVGLSLAVHVLAAAWLMLDLRLPYLRLLEAARETGPLTHARSLTLARRSAVAAIYLVQIGLGAWMLLPPSFA